MNIQNKWKLQEIPFAHSSYINFKNFINLYHQCTAKLYYFLVIDATLALYNPPRFWKNLLERIEKLIITITDDFEKQTEEQVNVIKSLDHSKKN